MKHSKGVPTWISNGAQSIPLKKIYYKIVWLTHYTKQSNSLSRIQGRGYFKNKQKFYHYIFRV